MMINLSLFYAKNLAEWKMIKCFQEVSKQLINQNPGMRERGVKKFCTNLQKLKSTDIPENITINFVSSSPANGIPLRYPISQHFQRSFQYLVAARQWSFIYCSSVKTMFLSRYFSSWQQTKTLSVTHSKGPILINKNTLPCNHLASSLCLICFFQTNILTFPSLSLGPDSDGSITNVESKNYIASLCRWK